MALVLRLYIDRVHSHKELAMNTTTMTPSFTEQNFHWRSIFDFMQRESKEKIMDTDRVYIPEDELMEYICDAIPQLKNKEIPTPLAWECKEQDLPLPLFKHGAKIVWNDAFISKEHGARKHCGEGPFEVYILDDYLVAFTKHEDGKVTFDVPRLDRITIESPSGSVIIAHPGYFKLLEG
ncbi:MAG: hypothetical protein A2494_03835 [Candidatus Lloydbacteria bacterium RIFOXYC12_FULL_46_25]|uniref:Uncharacterized protein n=1 Tax=Candidatus Lloydbacteria bacterium RIFOXYC12_FULL_46_25 TaxID=1798670 RepID=A0A1G2DRH4_9BACT|nr:MAG: hypothetical protein A2494_03835 [Candidatus Lloydbacteria bacterium RIFOXYC12_FULL_46_25]